MSEETTSAAPLTGARQTMMSWARRIDAAEDIPSVYRYLYNARVGDTAAMPHTVLAPPQDGAHSRGRIERLLFDMDDALHVLERAGARVTERAFPYRAICSFEIGNILLYSWFSLYSKSITGEVESLTVEFNEATLRHFEPFFRRLRPAAARRGNGATVATAGDSHRAEQAHFDYLAAENFKFMNFARESLTPGERVIIPVYQPASRRSVAALLGHHFYRTITPAHLFVLTDQELILIGDADWIAARKRSKYGGVRRFIPLRALAAVELEPRLDDLLALTLRVTPDLRVEKLFDAARRLEVEALKQQVDALIHS